jgi:hypothetical protein
MISDDGLGLYTVNYSINNLQISNSVITVSNGGSGYNVNTTTVTVTSANGYGSGATATANIVSGVIRNIWITNSGSGSYIINGNNNPTLTVIRGMKYIFSVNASGHPFWIQTVS